MIRINEIKLPLDHEEGALLDAITKKLGIAAEKVISFNVFRRGYDARKKTNIHLIYTLDIIVEGDEEALLAKFEKTHMFAKHLTWNTSLWRKHLRT